MFPSIHKRLIHVCFGSENHGSMRKPSFTNGTLRLLDLRPLRFVKVPYEVQSPNFSVRSSQRLPFFNSWRCFATHHLRGVFYVRRPTLQWLCSFSSPLNSSKIVLRLESSNKSVADQLSSAGVQNQFTDSSFEYLSLRKSCLFVRVRWYLIQRAKSLFSLSSVETIQCPCSRLNDMSFPSILFRVISSFSFGGMGQLCFTILNCLSPRVLWYNYWSA